MALGGAYRRLSCTVSAAACRELRAMARRPWCPRGVVGPHEMMHLFDMGGTAVHYSFMMWYVLPAIEVLRGDFDLAWSALYF